MRQGPERTGRRKREHPEGQIRHLIKSALSLSVPQKTVTEIKLDHAHKKELRQSRGKIMWHGTESLKPKQVANEITREVEQWVEKYGVGSPEELKVLSDRLDTASAISNDPKIRKLREKVAAKFSENIH
ncbi:MAG: hypothetical protein UY63_C0001G0054 [Parcubacteria group bacterium GW2011_GWA2_51_10]|nr:MAG: hypothetical protein UY63_C0001G0054 [Parcubacteria group bacterium GW2011_GWA2_51_10]